MVAFVDYSKVIFILNVGTSNSVQTMDHDTIVQLCRLCATKDLGAELAENSNNPNRETIIQIIQKYLDIKVSDNDILPRNFCSGCIQNLYSFDHFSQRCHQVQEMLLVISKNRLLKKGQEKLIQECDCLVKYETSNKHGRKASEWNVVNDNGNIPSENNGGDGDNKEVSVTKHCKNNNSLKRKQNRPKRNILKVPPLRIKAVRTKKVNPEVDTETNDSSITEYEIHNNYKKTLKERNDVSNTDDANFLDYDNYSNDSFEYCGTKDTDKTAKTNPFASFEYKCDTCHDVYKSFCILKRHCKKEHSTSAFVNCVCGKQLRARTAIIEHRRKHSGTSLYKCDICGKTFSRRSLMCLHMVSHVPKDEQPYVCCKCAKRFHTSSLLKKHEKVHLPEEERFVDICNICQKKFTSKSAVNAHLRAVHYGEKPFVCEHCGNSFSSKAILTDHLTTHSSYAPWPCNVCGRNFKSKYRLNVHMDMHRSVKYRCPHCPMELSTRRTLRMHLLVHKEEKAYVCNICSKAFRRSKDLKNHSNLHTGRRPYKCEFCGRTFANGSNCRAHKLRMHPDELGIEKNSGNSSKQAKSTLNNSKCQFEMIAAQPASTPAPPHPQPISAMLVMPCHVDEISKLKTLTTLTDVKTAPVIDYTKYENKYQFPVTGQDLDYSLDYAKYTSLNLNMRKPMFMQQPAMNHLPAFTTDMHTTDVSKMHFLYS